MQNYGTGYDHRNLCINVYDLCKIFIMPDWIAEAAQLVRNPRHETMEKEGIP